MNIWKCSMFLMSLVILVGCGDSDSPESVFKKYMESLEQGDVEGALKYVMEPAEEIRLSRVESDLQRGARMIQSGELELRYYQTNETAPWALVVYGQVYGGDEGNVRIVEEFLYFDGERWLLVPPIVRSDANVRALLENEKTKALFEQFRENLAAYRSQYAPEDE